MEKSRLIQLQNEIGWIEDTRKSFEWATQHTEDEEIQEIYAELIKDANSYTSFLSSKATELRRQQFTDKDPIKVKQPSWKESFLDEMKSVIQVVKFGKYSSYGKI
jgi:hypothetical protein